MSIQIHTTAMNLTYALHRAGHTPEKRLTFAVDHQGRVIVSSSSGGSSGLPTFGIVRDPLSADRISVQTDVYEYALLRHWLDQCPNNHVDVHLTDFGMDVQIAGLTLMFRLA